MSLNCRLTLALMISALVLSRRGVVPLIIVYRAGGPLSPKLGPEVCTDLGTVGPKRVIGAAGLFRSIGGICCQELVNPFARESLIKVLEVFCDGDVKTVRCTTFIFGVLWHTDISVNLKSSYV